jgi:hypothetical protein
MGSPYSKRKTIHHLLYTWAWRSTKLAAMVVGFIGVERFAHRQTDGFAITNIITPSQYERFVAEPPPPEVERLLSQPFTYLGCGAQSYAFVSADGNYVIKFFKIQHMRLAPWLPNFLPHVAMKRKEKEALYKATMESARIAMADLRDETGLLYVHTGLSPTWQRSIQLIDKIGVSHTLSLEAVDFVLQKRAAPFYETLTSWIEDGKEEAAHRALSELRALLTKRCQCGIFDKDPDIATNFGFVSNRPIQIDIGRFTRDIDVRHPARGIYEVSRISQPLHDWLEAHLRSKKGVE